VAELLSEHQHDISDVTVVPSRGGVFEVEVDGTLIFSKSELGRHAEPGEVMRLLAEHRGG
jgi:selenoprotein W-related protein